MPASALSFLRTPKLWLLAVAAGLTNICFNWAVTLGDVVRVVLLFYLMPAWSVLLAWWLLDERPTPLALLRLLLAFAGVVLVVLPPGAPLARLASGLSWIDLLAVAGGFCFALTNVFLRRFNQTPERDRMLAMFSGGFVIATAGALAATACTSAPARPEASATASASRPDVAADSDRAFADCCIGPAAVAPASTTPPISCSKLSASRACAVTRFQPSMGAT